MIEEPLTCIHCQADYKWKDYNEDGLKCFYCGCIYYNQEPLPRASEQSQEVGIEKPQRR